MSKQEFDKNRKAIEAIADQDVKQPNMPVGEFVQEAENTVPWCEFDKEKLVKAGLDWSYVEGLSSRAGACRYAQSLWARDALSQEEAREEWDLRSPGAYDLRNVLIHDFRHAFRKQADLKLQVRRIAEGGSNADMLQDLSDLKVLGEDNIPLLEQIGFDVKKLNEAGKLSEELSVVLAKANGENGSSAETKELRDKAYTHVKQALDEIRETGQYVFWRDEERRKGYSSAYFRRRSRGKKNVDAAE